MGALSKSRFVYPVFLLVLIAGCEIKNENPEPTSKSCLAKPETGTCRAAFERYYFDQPSGECRTFIWGGCGGTVPFESLESCLQSCVTKIDNKKQTALKQSLNIWKQLKEKNAASYQYQVSFQSWVGFGNTTTLLVKHGKLVERSYFSFSTRLGDEQRWTENETQRGSHQQAAPLKTIDQLYEQCQKDLLNIDENQFDINLSFNQQGILARCQYRNRNCADDCTQGVLVENFRWLKK